VLQDVGALQGEDDTSTSITMLVSAPMIARLLCRPWLWAYRRMTAGMFGPIVHQQGRWPYVSLHAVERVTSRRFDRDQLVRAGVPILQHEVTDGAEAPSNNVA
jgi:hypothetical protein